MMGASGAVKDTKAKEVKFGTAIALSFDQFESMHLAFSLALTVFVSERRPHCIVIPIKTHRKATEFGQPAGFGFFNPAP